MVKIHYFGLLENMQNNLGLFELDPLLYEPTNALKFISENNKLDSFRCPAVTDYFKNIFFIRSPLDFSIIRHNDGMYSIKNNKANSDLSSFLFAQYPETQLLNGNPVLQIHLQYFFLNNSDDIEMEVIDCPLINKSYTVIPGTYNISKWVRPTNFTFFMNNDVNEIRFRRGDPVYAVKFKSKNNVKLVEIDDDEKRKKILTEQQKALSIKKWYSTNNLTENYQLFQKRMKTLWRI